MTRPKQSSEKRASQATASVLVRVVTLVFCAACICALACGQSVKQAGLEVIVATNLSIPADFDTIHLRVQQQVDDGGWRPPIVDADFPVQSQSALPEAYGITPGADSDQVALIEVTAKLGERSIVIRTAQIQVPTDWLAQYVVLLSAKCVEVICLEGNTCDPDTGSCVPYQVPPSALGPYTPGQPIDAGMVEDVTLPPVDAGAAEDGTVPQPDASTQGDAEGDADAGCACNAASGATCDGGQCVCPNGEQYCDGACVDVNASDGKNCGSCKHSCLGGACTAGACQPTAYLNAGSGAPAVGALASDGATVFWGYAVGATAPFAVTILGCPDGDCSGTPVTVTSYSGFAPLALAVAGGTLDWITRGFSPNPNLFSCQTTGCGSAPLAHGNISVAGAFQPWAVDADNYYWVGKDASSQPAILACPVGSTSCGNSSVFSSATTGNIASHGALYWTDTALAAVMKCSAVTPGAACTSPQTIEASVGGGSVLAVDDANVYWADLDGVKQCPSGGCGTNAPVLLATGMQNAASMATDGTNLYWATGSTIVRARVGSPNSAAVIAQNQTAPSQVALGTKAVYWLAGGTTMMLAK
jgi:hypothetical protein